MRKSLKSIQKFISTHRALIAAGLTATAFLALMYRNAREMETFMADHGLTDEYMKWLSAED